SRERTLRILRENGAENVYNLDALLTEPIDNSGFNKEYGLLGSNKATDDSVKLFPRNCQPIVDNIQAIMKEKTGKTIEVMVYGDGAFKDPVGRIWELADPVVSPAFTLGLIGTPSEIKLKYLADNNFAHLKGEELQQAIRDFMNDQKENTQDSDAAQGT